MPVQSDPFASATTTDHALYANPRPFDDIEKERESLTGRIHAARCMSVAATRRHDSRTAARWAEAVDILLDHLARIEARVRVAKYDNMALGMGVVRASRGG